MIIYVIRTIQQYNRTAQGPIMETESERASEREIERGREREREGERERESVRLNACLVTIHACLPATPDNRHSLSIPTCSSRVHSPFVVFVTTWDVSICVYRPALCTTDPPQHDTGMSTK